jgi:hypothetical protein
MDTTRRMDSMKLTGTWMGGEAAFAGHSDAADSQARPGSQPDAANQQGQAQSQGQTSAATPQALVDCYNG